MPIGRKRTRAEVQQEPEGNPRIEAAPNIKQEAGGSEVTPNGGKTKKRGKTTLQVIPTGESQRQTIEWNEKGQPVGAQSVKFSSAVGCIVREQVPINIHDWRLVEDKTKNEVWGLLLQQYKVDLIHKPYILQQMGRLWRAYKSELTGSVMTVLESRRNRTETARLLGLIRPEDVPQAEWDQFVAERSTGEWKAKSEKMKAVRAKQLLPHTLSRKGYAREEYEHAEMEAKLAEQPPTEGPIPVKHDVLSQVLGKEKNGRVRGMGAGITPSRVDAQLQSGAWKQAFEDKLEATFAKTKMLEDMIFRLTGAGTSTATGGNGFVSSEVGSKRTSSHANAQVSDFKIINGSKMLSLLYWQFIY
ncbi:hypothetical protein ACLB2K_064334 [Fragaria x ananassa]